MQPGVIVFQFTDDLSLHRLAEGTASSLNEAQRALPDGVYTTFRTYRQTYVVRLADHFRRLQESAGLLGKSVQLDEAGIRAALAAVVADAPFAESRLRISIDLQRQPGQTYILIEPLSTPSAEEYQRGVAVVTRRLHRDNPKAKSTRFIQQAEQVKREANGRVNEVVMVSETDHILEGLSSNFFAIRGGAVWTAEEGVLSGVTRGMVIDVMEKLPISWVRQGAPSAELDAIAEAFLTSASRGVLPVTQIDGRAIGAGKPGPLTLRIRENFEQLLDELMEPIASA